MNKVVVLDPGHGGYDPGAVAYGLEEKDLNLMLALKIADRLSDVKVLLTRESDIFVSLADRVALSRRAGADLFLSLHANAGGGRGFESFIYRGLSDRDSAAGMQKAVHGQVMDSISSWQIVDRGMKRAAFYVLKHNPNPAVLIESLFLDNIREASIWREAAFVENLADGAVRGIKSALGLKIETRKKTGPAPLPEAQTEAGRSLYTVQVGAFAYIENARQRLTEAQEAGFEDAYIYQKQL